MTAVAAPAGPRQRTPALRLLPSRDETIDALMLLAMTIIGIVGFRPAYGGHDYLIAGAIGAFLGVALSHVGQRVRLPLLVIAAVSVLAFLVLGGPIAQAGAVRNIPTLVTMHEVASASIHGWKQLLTTSRPVGTTAHLLVLPYLLGLAAGVAGAALARRTSRVLLPASAPALVVALSILFGADHATAAVLQGAAFAGLALAWASMRQQRGAGQRTTIGRQRPWQRLGAAAAVLTVAVAGATIAGPHLPGAHAHQRVVLHAVPPFDVNAYPSPLAGFRDFTKDSPPSVSVWNKQLLTTTGLPPRTRVRIAAMDSYNGLVWGVANAAASITSFSGFQRIGSTLPGAGRRAARKATITIDSAYQLPWLPDLAGTTGFTFTGPAGHAVASLLRFNIATATGVVPGRMLAGLHYIVTAAATPAPTAAQLQNATPYGAPDATTVIPPAVQAFASAHAGASSSPVRKVLALAAYLRSNGRYSNGAAGQVDVQAGHSAGRLTAFLQSPQIIGDDEQYAATMALLADAAGVPARVALDGTVRADGSIYGRDVHADVELHLAQYGWVTLPYSQFLGTKQPKPQPLTTPPPAPAKFVPPPQSNPAAATANNESNAVSRTAPSQPGQGFQIPVFVVALLKYLGLPLLILGALAAALTGAKAFRRRRRRERGPAAARIAGAWRELLDLGRDLGIPPAPLATRREHAAHAEQRGLASATTVAVAADAAVFGREDPDDAAASRIWALVEETRHGAIANLARWRRAWVALNPGSLWASRPSWAPAGAGTPQRRGARMLQRRNAVTNRPRRPGPSAGGTHK